MVGEALYSTYLFPFEVASLILLVAMIGAIILAKRYQRTGSTITGTVMTVPLSYYLVLSGFCFSPAWWAC